METSTVAVLSAAIRQDFGLFLRFAYRELGGKGGYCHNWHIDAISYQLDRIREGENQRLIVTMPPRHLKSVAITTAWVAWMLGHNPALKFMCISYGQDLADEHASGCLRIMQSRWYGRAFPSLVLRRRAISDFTTSAGGGRMSTSIEGVTTGFGADIVIIDDPMKAQDTTSETARKKVEEWFDTTLMQRLNDQERGSIILVMQRLHEADLAGILTARGGWHELCLPAIAERNEKIPVSKDLFYRRREGCALHPEYLSLSTLHERRAANPFVFAAQYQQAPVPFHGNVIQRDWLRFEDASASDSERGEIVQSWDTASKDNPFSDWSVCITARLEGQYIRIIDVFRRRLAIPELKAIAIELARLHRAGSIYIEDASSGQQLIQILRAEQPRGVPPPIACKPESDKLTRVMGVSEMIASGRLILPKTAPWLAEFLSEVLAFPNGRHDDQVDALSQLLILARRYDGFSDAMFTGPEVIDPADYDGDDTWWDDDIEDLAMTF